jgi:hypothetical protein
MKEGDVDNEKFREEDKKKSIALFIAKLRGRETELSLSCNKYAVGLKDGEREVPFELVADIARFGALMVAKRRVKLPEVPSEQKALVGEFKILHGKATQFLESKDEASNNRRKGLFIQEARAFIERIGKAYNESGPEEGTFLWIICRRLGELTHKLPKQRTDFRPRMAVDIALEWCSTFEQQQSTSLFPPLREWVIKQGSILLLSIL